MVETVPVALKVCPETPAGTDPLVPKVTMVAAGRQALSAPKATEERRARMAATASKARGVYKESPATQALLEGEVLVVQLEITARMARSALLGLLVPWVHAVWLVQEVTLALEASLALRDLLALGAILVRWELTV
jgi:hypothetical protein